MAHTSAQGFECEPTYGTRAEILTLRNTSVLEPGCQYVITDYNRGCLDANGIILTATEVGQFSMQVQVDTPFDNINWEGQYDIDAGRLTMLEDNRNNHASGDAGDEVDAFPWGNAGWIEVEVRNAILRVDCDTTFRAYQTSITDDGRLEVTGATGYLYNSTIDSGSLLYLNDAVNATITDLEMGGRSRIFGRRSTNMYIRYSTTDGNSYWGADNSTNARLYQSNISSNSQIYYYDGTLQYVYYSNLTSNGVFRQYDGAGYLYYTSLDSYAEARAENNSVEFRLTGVNMSSRAYIRNYATGGFTRIYYTEFKARGDATFRQTGNLSMYYGNIGPYDAILGVTGTTSYLYSISLQSGGRFYPSGSTHYRVTLDTGAYINTAFATRYVYGKGRWTQTLTAANTNRGRDYFNNSLI